SHACAYFFGFASISCARSRSWSSSSTVRSSGLIKCLISVLLKNYVKVSLTNVRNCQRLSVLKQFFNSFPLRGIRTDIRMSDSNQSSKFLIVGKGEQTADAVLVKYAHDHGAKPLFPCCKTETLAGNTHIKHLP